MTVGQKTLLQTLKDVANRQLYKGEQIHFVPRGLVYPLDFGALGQIRFGKKAGADLPLLAPSNQFELVQFAPWHTNSLVLNEPPLWIAPGGYVSIGERELHEVDDVSDNVVFTITQLLADHEAGTRIFHYSNPITVEGSYVSGSTTINIDSQTFLNRGDVVAIDRQLGDVAISFTEHLILDLDLSSYSGGVYQYQLFLDSAIPRDLVDGEAIQLRAYLGYQSQILPIPVNMGLQRTVVGPFLLDWVSAPLRNKLQFAETQTVQLYDLNRQALGGPRTSQKNDYVLAEPIRADQLLFWQKVYGSINYDGKLQQFVGIADYAGRWRLKSKLVPLLSPPISYATGMIHTVAPIQLNNNEQVTLDDSVDPVVFEFKTSVGYVPTPSAAATGQIAINRLPTNNDWLGFNDGYGTSFVVEFQATGAYVAVPGRYTLDTRASFVTTDVAINLASFLNTLSGFDINAVASGNLVNLTSSHVSTKGNQPLTIIPGLLIGPGAWTITGMVGGTVKVVTVDVSAVTTDLQVAQLLGLAINSSGSAIKASAVSVIASLTLSNTIPGSGGNIPIVEAVADPGFLVSGMNGGGGGMNWIVSLKPEQNTLFKARFYPNAWQSFNLPAGVTTTIVLQLLATDQPVEFIDLLFKSTADSEVLIGDWSISSSRVGAVSYAYVARVLGSYNFASTTLLLKQLWPSLEDVKATHDVGLTRDGGVMRV
jgi:hypothetical protein